MLKPYLVPGCLACGLVIGIQPRRATDSAAAQSCILSFRRDTVLHSPDGSPMYVEANAIAPGRDGLLLAGAPVYIWRREAGGWRDVAGDSVIGVVIRSRFQVRLVPAPVPLARTSGVRAVATRDGSWEFVFAEMGPDYHYPNRAGSVLRLWNGRFEGGRWSRLTEMPLPRAGQLQEATSTDLVREGQGVAWAARVDLPDGQRVVDVYQKEGATWRVGRLPSHAVTDVYLASTADTDALRVAFAEPDSTSRGNAERLWIFRRSAGGWQPVPVTAAGNSGDIAFIAVAGPAGAGLASWSVDQTPGIFGISIALATFAPFEAARNPIVLDSFVIGATRPVLFGSTAYWVTQRQTQRGGELRLIAASPHTARVRAALKNPFEGPIQALRQGNDLVIVGPMGSEDSTQPPVVSLFLRVRSVCTDRSQRRRR